MSNSVILLVEDDEELANLTQDYLQKHGMKVAIEGNGIQAVERIIQEQPLLVILDVMLPGKDGFAICREVRDHYTNPILMLTARDEDLDQLLGLELGADDYVTKPVQPRLLLARIHALLRRVTLAQTTVTQRIASQGAASKNAPSPTLVFNDLKIDSSCREVLLKDRSIDLTTAEFDLLYLLAEHAGSVLSRDDILMHLRGIGYDGTDRSIDLRVSRLRKKLGDIKASRIKTVRGKGYLFIGQIEQAI
jgi:DNA-binding response OmpR family regulator